MRSRLSNMRQIFRAVLVFGWLLSASACFEIVDSGFPSGNQSRTFPVPSAAVTVTVTPTVTAFIPTSNAPLPPVPVKPGIVGLWNFDNNQADNSGFDNNGNIIAGATLTDGALGFGKALSSGINSYGFKAPDSDSLDISTNLTLEAWIKLDGVPDRSPLVSKTERTNTQKSYQLQIGADGHLGMSVWRTQEVTSFLRGETLLNMGQWYHVMGTYEYKGDGNSVMKVFVDDRLDGTLTDAVGPIFVGTSEFAIGKLAGSIDEVHVWNTSWPNYTLTVAPVSDINRPGSQCTITANITPAAPGVKVRFEVLPEGANSGQTAIISTDSKGAATWTYTDKSLHTGVDNIRVWIDQDVNGKYEPTMDAAIAVKRAWLDNFMNAGGNIMDGNRLTWTFAGSVGILGREMQGEFELIDHTRKVIYHSSLLNASNMFFPTAAQGFPIESFPAGSKVVFFAGTFTNDLDDKKVDLSIWVVDGGEPGATRDQISVRTGLGNVPGNIWIGTPNPNWTALQPVNYSLAVPISNGNIKVYVSN
jgi:hypothetical protein